MTGEDLSQKAFSPFNLMGLALRNRFHRSATLEGLAQADGSPGPDLLGLYKDLAVGGTGLISTSACWPDPDWVGGLPGALVLNASSPQDPWEAFVAEVHEAGTFISLQFGPFMSLGGRKVGPSGRADIHQLSASEIQGFVSGYAYMAARARELGFDAVQVHAGHGYPPSQFLSPHFNRRQDEYGGSTENRARLFMEIRKAVAKEAGSDFPVWIKLNSLDGVPEGLVPGEAAGYAPLLAQAGYGAIEVTGGSPQGTHDSRGPKDKEEWSEGFYLEGAALVKPLVDVPVAAVGGIRKLEMVEKILGAQTADLISLSRPLIREPGLVARWSDGDTSPARCISCNGCVKMMSKGKGLFCVQEKPDAR